MKKFKSLILVLSIVFIFTTFLILKLFPFGSKKYNIPNTSILLEIPKLSSFKSNDNNKLNFKSIRSKLSLEMELDNIIGSFKKKICNNETVYYDQKNDITIKNYGFESGIFSNSFYIEYEMGSKSNNECSLITDPKKLTHSILSCPLGICYGTNEFKYKGKDGNIYNLYFNLSTFLLFKNGRDEMHYFDSMLKFGWMSMQDVIDYLDYRVENNKTVLELKENYKIYKSKEFYLILCDNKTIYIEDSTFVENNLYCS